VGIQPTACHPCIHAGKGANTQIAGINAREVSTYNAFRTKLREVFSRALAVRDVELLHSEPRHYGEKIPL